MCQGRYLIPQLQKQTDILNTWAYKVSKLTYAALDGVVLCKKKIMPSKAPWN